MIEWLWQALLGQRLERILHGTGFQLHDAIFFGALAGSCIVATLWVLRRAGGKETADAWDKDIRKTAELAEREGWHGVLYWQRRFGYSADKKVAPRPASKNSARFDRLLTIGAIVVLVLIAWVTR